jgi:hypothetical protein
MSSVRFFCKLFHFMYITIWNMHIERVKNTVLEIGVKAAITKALSQPTASPMKTPPGLPPITRGASAMSVDDFL